MSKNKSKVLVIEDDEEMAEMLNISMSRWFDVDICTSKAYAIKNAKEYFKEHDSPDCVVIDLVINGEGGMDLYRWMKERNIDSKIIFLTGCHPKSQEYIEAKETGRPIYEKDRYSSEKLKEEIMHLVQEN